MQFVLSIFIIIPLFGFLISLIFQNKNEKGIALVVQSISGLYFISSIAFLVFWISQDSNTISQKILTLYKVTNFDFSIVLFYDVTTAIFSIVGAILTFIVARFSHFYMHRDEGFKRFFNTLLFFLLGYNLIIFSGNFETLIIGWEFIGLASFLLISFYRNRYLPVKNAFKILSIYRLSDISLIVAMWLMHHLTHQNINFIQLNEFVTSEHTTLVFIISLLIVIAVVAKSAQFPFVTLLPRAMEGPTSSSAIFYGSLSVHIGVFVLLRTYPFWENILSIKILIITIGILTATISTLISRVQSTVKTQIAYSSAAQIGIIFIEIAMGWHVIALIHFAGNAFLRTYQLLVSPSILNYLIHHQYFHHITSTNFGNNKFTNSFFMLGVKEWNLDRFLFNYLWSPFKWVGKKLSFLVNKSSFSILIILLVMIGINIYPFNLLSNNLKTVLQFSSLIIACGIILYVFASRDSALKVWHLLFLAHLFIALFFALLPKFSSSTTELMMYLSGIIFAYIVGYFSLRSVYNIDQDLSLNYYHGYVYEQKFPAFLFLVAAISFLGFPITSSFIGIDILFTNVAVHQTIFMILLALSFLFLELAVLRIYLRIFLGQHKKRNHPIAFRSS